MLSHDTAPEDTVRLENCQVPSKTRVFLFFITVIIFNGYIYIIIIIIIITHTHIYISLLFNYGHMMPIYPLPSIFPALDGAPPSLFPAQRFGAELKSMDDKGCFDNVSSAALINQ
jgi:hypothetical protein